jgi:c-di-GMP-binding flagellar brake protein YcgR
MSEQDILRLIQSIPDGHSATIIITDIAGERRHLQGVYKESEAPFFFFLSPPGVLAFDLDTSQQCPFTSQDRSETDVAFVAEIIAKTSDRALELVARASVRAQDLRQFFRVTMRTSIIVRYCPENTTSKQQPWEMTGETVDISQSGVLAILPDDCHDSNALDIEITLNNPNKKVYCTGHVIRSKRMRKSRWLISFHFDELSMTDRDTIAKNCFAEQRRQLRDKGQTF